MKTVFAFSIESEFEDHKEVELSHLFMWANLMYLDMKSGVIQKDVMWIFSYL